ncbi:MAG TPA: LTA synthase family protein [Burkholderiaceae bacterium]|nr:LTA synthase family protein [Burkholderiaceae bacterium]
MNPEESFGLGSLLALTGWWLARRVAGAGLASPVALLLDASMPALAFTSLLAITARPVFSGAVTLALAGGFAFSDRRKRQILNEPIVVSDVFLALDIFRHPGLALPFPDKTRVLGGAGAAVGAFAALFAFETPAWPWSPWPPLIVAGALGALVGTLAGPLNAAVGRALRSLAPSGDPVRDGVRLGPLATLLIYGIVARSERAARRVPAAPHTNGVNGTRRAAPAAPVVLVQCESFFDVRRIHPSVQKDLLPNLDRCRRTGLQWGRLAVPCWGANTVRTEFAVLTGLPEAAIGLDKFNPYQGFARAPVSSLAWQMRSEGYRTVCVHPFDRRFYGRNGVMRNLGFDEFLGEEVFQGAERVGSYVADVEVARFVARLLKEREPNLFVFIVTIENHGPWPTNGVHHPDEADGLWRGLVVPETERSAFKGFVQGVRNADAMLGMLTQTLDASTAGGLLALYGDHLPSFPKTFHRFGFHDERSDYLLWRAGSGLGARRDLAAQDLARTILEVRNTPVVPPAVRDPLYIGLQQAAG